MIIEQDLRRIAMEMIRRMREDTEHGESRASTCRVDPYALLALIQRCQRLRGMIGTLIADGRAANELLTADSACAPLAAEAET